MAVGRVVGGIGWARDLHLREKCGEDCGWASPRFLAEPRNDRWQWGWEREWRWEGLWEG